MLLYVWWGMPFRVQVCCDWWRSRDESLRHAQDDAEGQKGKGAEK